MKIILLLVLLSLSQAYDQLDNYDHILHYYQQYSHFPIVHVYYNHHFANSRQFEDFLNVIEETEYRHKDYVRFLLTDCDKMDFSSKEKTNRSRVCDEMRRTKDNHAVVGYIPSGEFINYAQKKMQNPPISRHYKHPTDVYRVDELQRFIIEMMPNFYEDINSMEDFQHWLAPRYSPNLILVTRQDDVPLVLQQLGVHYFLRFDLGYLNDLTESVVSHLNITTFPSLLVLKYNFQKSIHELHLYKGKELSTSHYQEIKAFLEPLALKQPRNDILFHKMKAPKKAQITITDNKYELEELLDRANGWAFISQTSGQPDSLHALKQKYGQFFSYYHHLNPSQETEKISLYDPEKQRMFVLPTGELQWKSLTKDEFIQNIESLLNKNFVIMGVRQKYSHFCTLALTNFFKGLTHCFILQEQDYEATKKQLNMEWQYGFVIYERIAEDGSKKVAGNNFKSDRFEEVYTTAQYQTRLKSKMIFDDFFQQPIKPIQSTYKLSQICAFPFKKCALLFTDSTKSDRTAYDYLKSVAKNFINEYQFYQIDLSCNDHFKDQIQHLRKTTNGLAVYHPRQKSYIYLKAKLSRTTFERFLKANLADDKKLPFRAWSDQDIQVHSCKDNKEGTFQSNQQRGEERPEENLDL